VEEGDATLDGGADQRDAKGLVDAELSSATEIQLPGDLEAQGSRVADQSVNQHRRRARSLQACDGNPSLMVDPTAKRGQDMMVAGKGVAAASEMINAQSNNKAPAVMKDRRLALTIWQKTPQSWTSNAGGGDNLHRNVIYRDGKEKADQVLPMTTFESENPEDLRK
jgi:hypothetical protein